MGNKRNAMIQRMSPWRLYQTADAKGVALIFLFFLFVALYVRSAVASVMSTTL